jgi:putative flippase GtrA
MPPSGQLARFGIIGGLATATHVAVAVVAVEVFGWAAFWANLLAFSMAVAVSYLGNHRWTFARSGGHARYLVRFVTVAIASLGLNQTIVFLIVDEFGWHYLWAITAVVLVVPASGFIASRHWAFALPPVSAARPDGGTVRWSPDSGTAP